METVRIETSVRPTEDPMLVEAAVRAIFPDAEVQRENGRVTATSRSLDTLLKKAREERVQDAARGALWRGRLDETATRFEINKQAAAVGRVNFNEVTHPLGDLVVTVETDDLNELLDRFAPVTPQEIMHAERAGGVRAAMHREEATLRAMGGSIDSGFDDWVDEDEELDDADLAESADEDVEKD